LVNALLTILFLSDTYGGRVHDLRIAEATPYPLLAGSRLLQDLGFLAFKLPQVTILMPTKNPRGQELTRGLCYTSNAVPTILWYCWQKHQCDQGGSRALWS
jgi:hypothetical protein